MTSVKVIGAGSIGNHLSNAARAKGWDVTLCDVDPAALERARRDIYPARYGTWDEKIKLVPADAARRGGYDWIFIGTPPDSHVSLALEALVEKPRAILVEKPFATPDLKGCHELYHKADAAGVNVFVGYDHVVSRSTTRFIEFGTAIGNVQTLDVEFREHWQGIFDAHPWLNGPADSYLGFWERGGGASSEHSHALNLWQYFAHCTGAGRVIQVSGTLDYITHNGLNYDRLAMLNLRTESGLTGRVVQDVVTRPPLKWARIQGEESAIEWRCVASPYADLIQLPDGREETFSKTRPDDFIQELDHLEYILESGKASPLSVERGLESMLVIAAAHLSSQVGRTVSIDYTRGYTRDALVLG